MFNLLIRYQPWSGGRETLPSDRIFEYTDGAWIAQYRPDKGTVVPDLLHFPCLFMQEGTRDGIARVGTITRARQVGSEFVIEYFFEQTVPPLLNEVVYAHKVDFDMPHAFEFNRTHWAIKDVDLYKTLLHLVRPRRQLPSVFTIQEHERIEPELLSVMMPFAAEFDPTYKAIQQSAADTGMRCRRADDIWEAPAIIQDVVNLIDRSRIVICDCTGRNPNVFYEAGIAHTLGREVVLITQNPADIPFDLRHLRFVHYLNNAEGRANLSQALSARLRTVLELA
jgi:hypothetical protein